MAEDILEQELKEAVERVLRSTSKKKLIVAGPGAGKTFLFKRLLEGTPGTADDRLVLTFINNLKSDLERSLGDLARVNTLHGYCQAMLHRFAGLREGLTSDFVCFPGLVSLIKIDHEWLNGNAAPKFVELMRNLECTEDQQKFYFRRANYYEAVDFDDSVYRTLIALRANKALVPSYELVLIDEFQDFNEMEATLIDVLGEKNSITIAGDDDQALYSQLRDASWEHIRQRHGAGEYEVFNLPFCMRCPEVIVDAVNDVLMAAKKLKKLDGRIDKPYRFYPPKKGDDSKRFPRIDQVNTTVQRGNANYFGKYADMFFKKISKEELEEAESAFEPALLIIGSDPYRRQIKQYLTEAGLYAADQDEGPSDREIALDILHKNSNSNLGWRIILNEEIARFAKPIVVKAAEEGRPLVEVLPDDFRKKILEEAAKFAEARAKEEKKLDEQVSATPAIKITSFEGSKGLSAQYVLLIGVHEDELPRDAADPKDIEICRFLVGLTRTKRNCGILTTSRFGQEFKRPSLFLSWINKRRFEEVAVNAKFWDTH